MVSIKFGRAAFLSVSTSVLSSVLLQQGSAVAESVPSIPRLTEIEQPNRDAKLLFAQTDALIQIINSELRSTATGFTLDLQTANREPLQGITSQSGNTLTIEVVNAQVQQELSRQNPISGVASIEIRNQSANQVRVTVVGVDSVPAGKVTANQAGLTIEVQVAEASEEEEVVVTAQKRPEPQQDVPISLTVLPRQTLEDAQINSLQSIANNTPNFSFLPTTAGSPDFAYYSVRGLNNFNFLASQDSVGFYLDDVPFDYGGFLDLGLLDLERVEVLRGPQSTLYGRSSPAGVVNIISRTPTNQPEVRIQGGYGSYNAREAQLSLSDAIVPNVLAFRLSGAYRAQDGFFKNAFLDRTVGDRQQLLGRAQLLWTPSKEWSVSFNSYVIDNDNGDVVFTRRDGDPFTTSKPVDGFNRLNSNTQALRVNYDGAGFRATSITARRGTRQEQLIGDAFFPGVDSARSNIDISSTVWSQEIRLQSPSTANRFRWLAGGYYESRAFNVNTDGFDYTPTGAAAFGLPSAGLDRVRADQNRVTYAAFGQIDYKLVDPLTLFAGLRYETSNLSLDRERTFESGGTVTTTSPRTQDQLTSSQFIPRFGAQYRFSPNVAAYATIAKGYRPSGFNYRADTEDTRRYGEERTWTYEAGIKSSWFNDRLTANLAVFHNDVDGYQVLLADQFGFFRNVTNANVKATGLELELKAQVFKGFDVIAGLGYVDSRFKNYRNSFSGADFSDNRVPFSPNLTYNLALQYRSPGGIFARAELRGFGKTYFDDANLVEQDPFALVNLRVGYEWRNYGIYLFANNVFDTRYITSGFLFPPPRVTAGFGEPVTVGFQVRAAF